MVKGPTLNFLVQFSLKSPMKKYQGIRTDCILPFSLFTYFRKKEALPFAGVSTINDINIETDKETRTPLLYFIEILFYSLRS
jgi:hypothetical protein